jgi:hypothetical protein
MVDAPLDQRNVHAALDVRTCYAPTDVRIVSAPYSRYYYVYFPSLDFSIAERSCDMSGFDGSELLPPRISPFAPGETDVVTWRAGGFSFPAGVSIAASPAPTAVPDTAGVSVSSVTITSDNFWTTPNTNLQIVLVIDPAAMPTPAEAPVNVVLTYSSSDGVRIKPRSFQFAIVATTTL